MNDRIPLPGAETDARIVLIGIVGVYLLLAPTLLGVRAAWAIYLLYLIPLLTLVLFGFTLRLAWPVRAALSSPAAIVVVLLAGGIAFDVVATLLHSPDLAQEANPVARVLLDNGYDLPFVYLYGGAMQTLYLGCLSALWVFWLGHREAYLTASLQSGTPSFLHFLKAATGGGTRTWRQWLLPVHPRDLPEAYPLLCAIIPILVLPVIVQRWYLGLIWFGLVPWVTDALLITVLVVSATLLMLVWLFVQYAQHRHS